MQCRSVQICAAAQVTVATASVSANIDQVVMDILDIKDSCSLDHHMAVC